MIKRFLLVLTPAVLLALPVAADVFTWTDAQGNVHFSDRPEDPRAAQVDVKSSPTDHARLARQKQASLDLKQRNRVAATERDAEAEKQATNDERIAENCRRAEKALESIVNAQRLYVPEPNGERRFLNEEEKQARIAKARADVDEWCNQE